jgi:hypothetical protein
MKAFKVLATFPRDFWMANIMEFLKGPPITVFLSLLPFL